MMLLIRICIYIGYHVHLTAHSFVVLFELFVAHVCLIHLVPLPDDKLVASSGLVTNACSNLLRSHSCVRINALTPWVKVGRTTNTWKSDRVYHHLGVNPTILVTELPLHVKRLKTSLAQVFVHHFSGSSRGCLEVGRVHTYLSLYKFF